MILRVVKLDSALPIKRLNAVLLTISETIEKKKRFLCQEEATNSLQKVLKIRYKKKSLTVSGAK